jgi:hypothetical protein
VGGRPGDDNVSGPRRRLERSYPIERPIQCARRLLIHNAGRIWAVQVFLYFPLTHLEYVPIRQKPEPMRQVGYLRALTARGGI